MMGGDANISGLAFDQVLELLPNSGLLWEIIVNSINWMYTNWKGMTFGVLFAACALTLFGLIERRGFENPFANAALGAAIGTPLGVCVNCAAPIARGLHSAGMRLETTLSALVASPTLNVIVVSMSFALLPTHMAAIKLLGALAFVIVDVPVLTRLLGSSGLREEAIDRAHSELDGKRGWIARKLEGLRPLPVACGVADSVADKRLPIVTISSSIPIRSAPVSWKSGTGQNRWIWRIPSIPNATRSRARNTVRCAQQSARSSVPDICWKQTIANMSREWARYLSAIVCWQEPAVSPMQQRRSKSWIMSAVLGAVTYC